MVQIPVMRRVVETSDGVNSTPESVLVELQGELMTDNGTMLGGQEIGTLHFGDPSAGRTGSFQKGNASEKAVLLIGNYALTGEVVMLPKPLVLFRKSHSVNEAGESQSALEMETVIRKKVLFKDRPRHVIQPSSS